MDESIVQQRQSEFDDVDNDNARLKAQQNQKIAQLAKKAKLHTGWTLAE